MNYGTLIINVYSGTVANPVVGAQVVILKNDEIINEVKTNENGQTPVVSLETVDKIYSEEDQHEVRPYETYDILVSALGLAETKIKGIQIFEDVLSMQDVYLKSIDEGESYEYVITPNVLWGEYTQNISDVDEDIISPYVLSKVVIPENIIVHDGAPSSSAPNYTVPFTTYIKNVASSEIYSTWPKETIRANILAIISFTLNRIFTEWYKSKGYDFTITSTTSYDQKYTPNGTIFDPISKVVDEFFDKYIREGFRIEPLLAHYKSNTTEPGYLSQWGSKELGDRGYNYVEILKYYYGDNINIYRAELSGEYPYSFTETLKEGDCSKDVYILQNTLNYIISSYPGIPIIENANGLYDENTTKTVKSFQEVFDLDETGTVNYETWYKISYIFNAVAKMTNSIYK